MSRASFVFPSRSGRSCNPNVGSAVRILAGQDQNKGSAIVRFDPSGAASSHYVMVSQPSFDNLFTVEVMALTGLIKFHDGLFEREQPEDDDFE